jgi:hypothetical protein
MTCTSNDADVRKASFSLTAEPAVLGSSTFEHRVSNENREPLTFSELFLHDSLSPDIGFTGTAAGSHANLSGQTLLSEAAPNDFLANIASSHQSSSDGFECGEPTRSCASVTSDASFCAATLSQLYGGVFDTVAPVPPNYTITWDPEGSKDFIQDHDFYYYANWHHYVPPKPLIHEPALRKGYQRAVARPRPLPQQPLRDPPCLTYWKRCTLTEEELARCKKYWGERDAKRQRGAESSFTTTKKVEEDGLIIQEMEVRLKMEIAKATKAAEEVAAEVAALEAGSSGTILNTSSFQRSSSLDGSVETQQASLVVESRH